MNRTICYPFQGFHGAGLPPSNLTKVTWRGSLATLPSVVFFQSSLPTLIAFQGAFILRWETHSGSMWVFGRHAGKILHEFSATEVDMYVVLKQMKTLIKLLYMPTISHLFISSFPQLKTPCFLFPGGKPSGGGSSPASARFPGNLAKASFLASSLGVVSKLLSWAPILSYKLRSWRFDDTTLDLWFF